MLAGEKSLPHISNSTKYLFYAESLVSLFHLSSAVLSLVDLARSRLAAEGALLALLSHIYGPPVFSPPPGPAAVAVVVTACMFRFLMMAHFGLKSLAISLGNAAERKV